jgi:uncharacterized protein YecT (DUF1311 family)
MKNITLFTFLFLSIITRGQKSLADSLKTLPCTQAETQLEMNECSALQLQIADNMLDELFNEINDFYLQTIKEVNTPDADIELVKALNTQQKSFAASQLLFKQYREKMATMYSLNYYGGSMETLMYNVICTQLTVERVELLKSIKAEL